MAIKITVNLEINSDDLLTGYGAGALLRLYSATSRDGSYGQVTTAPIVSGTEQYEFWDSAGTNATWYKTKVTNSGGLVGSDWSDPFQATALAAYATIDDLTEVMNFGTDQSKLNALADLLVDASEMIDADCGRSFLRNPQVSGDGTWTFRVVRPGQRRLTAAIGKGIDIVSVTTLEIADVDGGTWRTIDQGSSGYYLVEGDGPTADWPYEDLELSWAAGTYSAFPRGDAIVRLTGVLGFNSVPRLVRRATVDMVREWWRQGPQGGTPAGVNQFGAPLFLQGEPHSYRKLKAVGSPYVRRSWAAI